MTWQNEFTFERYSGQNCEGRICGHKNGKGSHFKDVKLAVLVLHRGPEENMHCYCSHRPKVLVSLGWQRSEDSQCSGLKSAAAFDHIYIVIHKFKESGK